VHGLEPLVALSKGKKKRKKKGKKGKLDCYKKFFKST
jgi:hypothetical protein